MTELTKLLSEARHNEDKLTRVRELCIRALNIVIYLHEKYELVDLPADKYHKVWSTIISLEKKADMLNEYYREIRLKTNNAKTNENE